MAEEGKSFNELLDGTAEFEDIEPEAAEPAKAEGPQRDEHGRFVAKETGVEPQPGTAAEAVPPTDKLPQDEYKAIREEREKRQALERELADLRQRIEESQKPADPPPSMWEDDQAWQEHFGSKVVNTAVETATYKAKLNASEIIARQAHEDFGEVWEPMNAFLRENPALAQKVAADAHPWGAAYKAYKNHRAMQELGAVDLTDLEAKMREKILSELQQGSEPLRQQPAVPPSLTTERNVGTRSGPEWSGPKPLTELLG